MQPGTERQYCMEIGGRDMSIANVNVNYQNDIDLHEPNFKLCTQTVFSPPGQ